ncbi:MAG: SLC13 family permease [Myxococcota bacterium]
MGIDGWISLGVTAAIVLAMMANVAGPDMIMVAALAILLATGVISPADGLVGFANPGVLTVAALFVVAAGLRETGGLDFVARRLLGRPTSVATAQIRLMTPIAAMSAFLNNTPVVALMVPIVTDWARRTGLPSSKLLIPLSYAAILGGTCTLIGTSTNLVVAGLAESADPNLKINMFDLTWLGLPATVVGITFIVLTSRWLLPARRSGAESLDDPRQYSLAMEVTADAPVAGQTIEEAGLRQLPGLFLVEIERNGDVIVAVGPEERLRAGDVLVFAGVVDSVVDLRKIRGLRPATDQVHKLVQPTHRRRLVEAVVGAQSVLAGANVRDSRFRSKFGAAIIAVHRRGARIPSKIGDIVLQAGDTLLLETHPGFARAHRNDKTFALVSEVAGSSPPRHDRAWVAVLILFAMVALNVMGALPLLTSALLAAGAMVVFRCLSGEDARRALDLRVLLTIAASFGVAAALSQSGAAATLADGITDIAKPFGPAGLLVALYILTATISTIVGNNAGAALMFPIAFALTATPGVDPKATLLVLMMAASASFATPIGYQTNLMVFGPGGYTFGDFFRAGVPLQIVVGVVSITIALALF